VELLLLLWSRKELGLAYVNACTDDDEEDIVASQKQNPWQIVLSLSHSQSKIIPSRPNYNLFPTTTTTTTTPHFLVGQTERHVSACKTLNYTKILNS
jgi:hypothetical protein